MGDILIVLVALLLAAIAPWTLLVLPIAFGVLWLANKTDPPPGGDSDPPPGGDSDT